MARVDTGGVLYRFEDTEVNCDTFEILAGGTRVPVEPQVFEVIRFLVERRERMCTRAEILEAVWGDHFVSDSALASRISAARAAVGDDGRAQRVIRTVHGRGFQFVAPVEVAAPGKPPALVAEPEERGRHQSIRFCQAPDGIHLAVAEVGSGPPLVKAATWMTHVEHDWHSPVWRHWLDELGARFRYIRYDARGGGLSDRDLTGCRLDDLATWTSDLETAVDCSDVQRFVLFAMSQGVGHALDYCVRHPDRVSHLVILGGYARGMRRRDADAAAQAALLPELIRVGWGGSNPAFRTVFTTTFVPEATSEQMRWFNELALQSASAENAVHLETAFHDQDFSDLARAVRVPTLVLHARDDRGAPFSEGRLLASLIPGAEFVPLDSANHVLLGHEPAWAEFLAHLDRFTADA
jgi:DNA-binding winged helix-turn-helix (wHTH) protein/alpha-beta hydrolase superfamily lysophospholipase